MDWERDSVGGNTERAPRLSDMAQTLDLRDGKPHTIRLLGPARRVARHWITTKSKEGKRNKPFPKICLGYNSETGEFDGECPYCELEIRASIEVHQNGIDRDIQEDGPPKRSGDPTKFEKKMREHFGYEGYYKESKDTKVWTPAVLATLSTSPALKIKDTIPINKVKGKDGVKKTYPPHHPKYGYDLVIQYHDKRQGPEKYSVVKDERTVLSEEELEYHLWQLDLEKPESLKAAKEEAKRLKSRLWKEDGDNDDDDDDDKPKKKKRHQEEDEDFDDKKSKKSSKKSRDDDDDDDDEEDEKPSKSKKRKADWDDEDDDDEDEKPSKSKKSSKKSRDDDDDEDEDDEDERPSKSKKSSSKKRSRDDDDDEDDDDEDEKPSKSKKSRKSRDDDDEDDDDEDERPAKKSSKKKSRDDDDDDEDEDERPAKKSSKKKSRDDDDDDDEDEKPSKSKSKSSKAKKRKLDDDDEDDEWDDEDD